MIMNNKRCFSFGCSYTNHCWATWADFVGSNFDIYINFGRGGASNTFIMNQVFEQNDIIHFNTETDFIIVMFTGISRFSYIDKKLKTWQTNGDLRNLASKYNEDPTYRVISNFVENVWSEKWAVYQSWIAIKAVKEFLTSKNLKHKILMGIDNSYYISDQDLLELSTDDIVKINDIYSMLDIRESLDEFVGPEKKVTYFLEDKISDGHPTQSQHFQYMSKHFPEFVTPKSTRVFQEVESIFDNSSRTAQSQVWNTFRPNEHFKYD
jgi:hypothetical protein